MALRRDIRIPVGDPEEAQITIERLMTLAVGNEAPDFSIETIDGKKIKLSELKGKVVLLDFWATWCGPCILEMPNIRKVYEKYGDSGDVVVLGISLDESEKLVTKLAERNKVTWPQYVGGPAGKNPVAKAYNVSGIPATFLIDREGKIAAVDMRGDGFMNEVDKLLSAVEKHAQAD